MKVRRSNAMYVHKEYPFMLADVDRLIIGENAGLECKTASPYSYEKWAYVKPRLKNNSRFFYSENMSAKFHSMQILSFE